METPAHDPASTNGATNKDDSANGENGNNVVFASLSTGKPPLGRHASSGDQPITLGTRQDSVGVLPDASGPNPAAAENPVRAPAPAVALGGGVPTPAALATVSTVKPPSPKTLAANGPPPDVSRNAPPPVVETTKVPDPPLQPTPKPELAPMNEAPAPAPSVAAPAPAPPESPSSPSPASGEDDQDGDVSMDDADEATSEESEEANAPVAAAPQEKPKAATAPAAAAQPKPAAWPPQPAPGYEARGGTEMKELKVEDALLYLDDVKKEFGHRPRVYNEFLAIMKNFKSQEVDTPGVIEKVSKLFRGYNNLILGFNKFLPNGYKITTEDLKNQDAKYAREQQQQQQQEALRQHQLQQLQQHQKQQQQQQQQPVPMEMQSQQQSLSARSPQAGIPAAAAANARPAYQGHDPRVLPSARIIPNPPQRPPAQARPAAQPQHQRPAQQQQQQQQQQPPQQPKAQPQPQQQQQQQGGQGHQAVEFDHAISYVTTIKRRFANDPSTYHSFLEILHTYQKEQRGIKEVLEQVARLFQDHPDLLREFTFFLPDAVQEQAKERLQRAAADSEARQAAAQRAAMQNSSMDVDSSSKSGGGDGGGASTKFIDMTGQNGGNSDARSRKRSQSEMATDAPVTVAAPQAPETYVYNSAVERQFFDAAREALASYTRDGGQAWAEFLKCLDMYAQEILSRNEMLNFVEPLLGKRNTKLFEEFKRILNAAGSASGQFPSFEDSWHSVPLSEIDFSRCRHCTPSYRALPRDYPAPPCSGRSDEESKNLNNVWVSLPVGSEESYTFRHMRRNACEEVLFRCEDERFEIDMVIDSNACTLARLEPIAEEIAQLAENELIISESSTIPRPAAGEQGMGGKRYQFTFDQSILGVIHRNSISRIYGDAGQEILELIEKNPTVTIPVVVQRLRQKDIEWRRVRDRMNRQWKELAEENYFKSLDHRSLTWRTTDKRVISTRTLVAEIKDRSLHKGKEGESSLQARMDKAKEEHGTFYQVTMKHSLARDLDLTSLPKADRRLFTPHMSLMGTNDSSVHMDAYRIISFAVERGAINPTDKERIHRLWIEFLGPWFKLSTNQMLMPAAAYQESSKKDFAKKMTKIVSEDGDTGDEESLDGETNVRVVTEDAVMEDQKNASVFLDHHPLPSGALVSTLFGEGQVIKFRRSDNTYIVRLPFGKAYLAPSGILCSILGPEKSAYTTQLREKDTSKLLRPDDQFAIGTQSLYLFFRLFQILVERLEIARELAYNAKRDQTLQSMVEKMEGHDEAALGKKRYDAFLSLVFGLLDGNFGGTPATSGKYEDRIRMLLGHGGYAMATMDKLISHILKNMQSMVNDDAMWNLVQLYRRHLEGGDFKPEAFRQEAAFLSDGEVMFAFQKCPIPKNGGKKCVLYIEHLGVISESDEEGGSVVENTEASPANKRPRRDR
ncbi:unnamed protein product [Cylindrotheca closterium]|uniref:Histone deacetylase interacting domain-containing protein n=1 Tax=Cylindrotheca closterium TaxID=2856 RepID=A0AAD2FKZ8_9STRA|nr:unnamed protein product [Cylindrotheca closterium]